MAAPPVMRSVPARLLVVFFALSGALEMALAFADATHPSGTALWEALGRATLHWLLATGLAEGFGLCRTLALVYCLAALCTYAVVLALALAGAPLRFPPSVMVQSLVQVPSCALLLPWLRSPAASRTFSRRLLDR
jgi:hypothetical protein